MPGVTISAQYGTGGARIGKAVAARLNVPCLDRALSATVSERLRTTDDIALLGGTTQSRLDRILCLFRPFVQEVTGVATFVEDHLRHHATVLC